MQLRVGDRDRLGQLIERGGCRGAHVPVRAPGDDVDDRRAVRQAREHGAQERDGREHRVAIRVLEVVERVAVRALRRIAEALERVVDDEVHARPGRGDEPLAVVVVGEIARERHDVGRAGEASRVGLERPRPGVADDKSPAQPGEGERECRAEAVERAGDDGGPHGYQAAPALTASVHGNRSGTASSCCVQPFGAG